MKTKSTSKKHLSGSSKPASTKEEADVKAALHFSNPMNETTPNPTQTMETKQTTSPAIDFEGYAYITANFVDGILSVSIYDTANHSFHEAKNFINAANALNYAFLLKKRHGLFITERAFRMITDIKKETGAISTRAKRHAEAAKAAAIA